MRRAKNALEGFSDPSVFNSRPLEYNALVSSLRSNLATPEDAYQQLMAKEQRVLDTVNRVVDDRLRVEGAERTFFDLSLHEIVVRMMAVARGIMDDLIVSKNLSDVMNAFSRDDRTVYVGLALILATVIILSLDL